MPLRELDTRHAPLIDRLCRARLNGRIAHAYLFTGDDLAHLQDLARGWAQTCLCTSPTAEGDACGTCRTCRQLAVESYPYAYVLRPQSKIRTIRVDAIRELEHRLHLKTEFEIKLGIIVEADRMLEEAQNAFLKTLEEPPRHTMLLLLSVNPAALLPTIRSRCQTVALMDNRHVYAFPDQEAFFGCLAEMRRGTGAKTAVKAAEFLTGCLKSLHQAAEADLKDRIDALKANYQDLESAQKKQVDADIAAMTAAEYLSRREELLSALHSWFAQEYLRANGVADHVLPNPEILTPTGEDFPPGPPGIAEGLRSLRLTETFMANLRYNIDEGLAVQDFCQKVCAKA